MSSADPSTTDILALVNSFYGPGATACWYLTCLACLISWTIHPKTSRTDAVTSNFIALITFPTVASAHLITQIWNYHRTSLNGELLAQVYASMAASLIITETYLAICLILLLPTIFRPAVKRIVLLASTGIFCVVSVAYLFFSIPSVRITPGIFDRSLIANPLPLVVMMLVIVSILIGIFLAFLYFLVSRKYPDPFLQALAGADPEFVQRYRVANDDYDLLPRKTKMELIIFIVSFVVISLLGSIFSPSRDTTTTTGRRSLLDEFFPKTDTGIMELNQAVSLLAGMTVLGFALYSAADARYKKWWGK